MIPPFFHVFQRQVAMLANMSGIDTNTGPLAPGQ